MTLDEYLGSETAVRDATLLLDPSARGLVWGHVRLSIVGARAWQCVVAQSAADDQVRIYFRAEGDRFIVSDLGEGVRALRLRTGRISMPSDKERVCFEAILSSTGADFLPYSDTLAWPVKVPAADLPRAIVSVMLAAYRVANLEVGK